MEPLGFTVNMFTVSKGDPAEAFQNWIDKAPGAFAETFNRSNEADCLGKIKNFHSQMAIAQERRQPIFRVNNRQASRDVAALFADLAASMIARMDALDRRP